MGHLQEVGNVCQLGGRGSVCGPFQSGWVKYEIQLPGFILVYGSYLCMEPSPAALQGMGAVCVLCVCVCVECAETTVGITRNVSKSDGTVNSHLSPGRVLDDLPILATSQAAFFCLGPPQIGVICSLSFLFPANLVKLGSRNPFKRMHFPPCLSWEEGRIRPCSACGPSEPALL